MRRISVLLFFIALFISVSSLAFAQVSGGGTGSQSASGSGTYSGDSASSAHAGQPAGTLSNSGSRQDTGYANTGDRRGFDFGWLGLLGLAGLLGMRHHQTKTYDNTSTATGR